MSTDFIFDGKNGPYKEDDQPNPLSHYGKTKLEAEKIIQEYKDKGTIDMSELEPAEDVEVMEDEPMQVEEEPMEEDMPMGLMARRNV